MYKVDYDNTVFETPNDALEHACNVWNANNCKIEVRVFNTVTRKELAVYDKRFEE